MNYTKKIICLANSRKHSGRCFAGREVLESGYGGWIRPISSRPTAELSEEERRYEDGSSPKISDIIQIPMLASNPNLYQTENHIIDSDYYWKKLGSSSWEDIKKTVENPLALWTNDSSTYYGKHDRVAVKDSSTFDHSLIIIKPESLAIHVALEGSEFGNPKRRVRAEFKYHTEEYYLIVTDPDAERAFLAKSNDKYPLNNVYLCLSLGEAHTDGFCYKLVAAIISKQPL